MLVNSAILLDGQIYVGKRHWHCIRLITEQVGFGEAKRGTQGFVDDQGVFYSRAEALIYVKKVKQPYGPMKGGVLTSEDLW